MSIEHGASPETLDGRWYKRFEAVAFEDYEKLTGNKEAREHEKEQFLQGTHENPTLDYPVLESFDLEAREEALLSLKADILELEQNSAVAKIYRTKINESLATLRMLKATRAGDDRKFSHYADFIYGKPEAGDVAYIVQHVKELIAKHHESTDDTKRQAAARLHGLFDALSGDIGDGVDTSILPAGQTISGTVSSAEEAVAAFEAALQEINADDWTVVVDSESGITNFSVSQEHKIVRIPAEEVLIDRKISNKKLQGLIEHEVKTHVARRHNGERSRLQLLGLGLDRYLKAEEGIATYAEQQVTGAKEFAGIPRFLSIALAKGLTGQKMDFRQTHTVMTDYRILAASAKESAPEKAAVTAYNDCLRIFRGTTCKTPGAVYPKDMVYFGNRAIWNLVSKNSDVVQKFSIGKYDPTNEEHVALLTELGILDDDLARLEGEV